MSALRDIVAARSDAPVSRPTKWCRLAVEKINLSAARGDYLRALEMSQWLATHCVFRGSALIHDITVWPSLGEINNYGEDAVCLGIVLLVEPREPNELQSRVTVRAGKFELNIVSHFTLREFDDFAKPLDVALATFFRNAILDALQHEVDECIEVDGARRFDPHADGYETTARRTKPFRTRTERDGQKDLEVTATFETSKIAFDAEHVAHVESNATIKRMRSR